MKKLENQNDRIQDNNFAITYEFTDVVSFNNPGTRIVARIGDVVIRVDTINLEDESQIDKFLSNLHKKAYQHNFYPSQDELKSELIRQVEIFDQEKVKLEHLEDENLTTPDKILDAFGIDVLGEQDDQSIVFWSKNTKKIYVIKSLLRWSPLDVIQSVGDVAIQKLWNDDKPAPDGMFSFLNLQMALSIAASRASRMTLRKRIGQGIWKRSDDFLIVNETEAFAYRDGKFRELTEPRYGDEVIEFNSGKKWLADDFQDLVENMTVRGATEIVHELSEIATQWNWSHKLDHLVFSRLVVASFIQACWSWRPLISIIGASDCGKSTLFSDVLLPIYGDWTIATDRSTEAGLRQAIGHSAAPVLIDEFDKYQHREKVLQLFRTSSRGGKIYRGTANQTGLEFSLQHIPWMAAIESGDIWAQDRNRFIRFDLLRPKQRGVLNIPSSDELAELGQRLCAVALWAAPMAIPLADKIKSTKVDGVPGRIVESFSVPAALYAVIRYDSNQAMTRAIAALKAFLGGREASGEQGEPDENQLLRDILASTIRVSVRVGADRAQSDRTVGQILTSLNDDSCYETYNSDLQTCGIRLIDRKNEVEKSLFLASDVVRVKVLQNSRWASSRIDQILMRLPGADRSQQRCGGQRLSGIVLPWPGCLEFEKIETTV